MKNAFMEASQRPARLEIDLKTLRKNMEIIINDKKRFPRQGPGIISVLKDQAYGHGAVKVAEVVRDFNPEFFAVATIDEALDLRKSFPRDPVFIFGERPEYQWETCIDKDFTIFLHSPEKLKAFSRLAEKRKKSPKIIVEIDTGLSRYGLRWDRGREAIMELFSFKNITIHSFMSHFAMSDELDKTFAKEQLRRFNEFIQSIKTYLPYPVQFHMCNSGGYLDLPDAHFDFARLGILPLGVFPSDVCRRIEGLKPVMSLKAEIALTREIHPGDHVGYGMRFTAEKNMKIAVIPVGYGDGYPRVRNQGHVLIHGQKAPVIGGNAMDVMMVDISHIPQTRPWDEAVLLGKQGDKEISIHDLAKLKKSVSYDVMTNFSPRLPRFYK